MCHAANSHKEDQLLQHYVICGRQTLVEEENMDIIN